MTYTIDETNKLTDGFAYHNSVSSQRMTLRQLRAAGGRITRLRFLTEYIYGYGRFYDVSYIHATLPDGTIVSIVGCPLNFTPAWRVKFVLVDWAKEEGVYAKAIGLLDESNWSVLK
jgi:hypothetical protein